LGQEVADREARLPAPDHDYVMALGRCHPIGATLAPGRHRCKNRPVSTLGSIGWTERTGGVLTTRDCLTLAGPLLRGELGILAGRLAMALRLHSGRRSAIDPESLVPPDSSLARDADVMAHDLLT